MPVQATDASLASSGLLLNSLSDSRSFAVSRRSGTNYSLATMSLALSFGATGLFVAEPQAVLATEAAALENSQASHPFSQGENFMIPAPVTLATAPEVQPVVESNQNQLVAAASPSSTQLIEPELPAIKHVVAEDETFWSIAQRYGVSVEAIAALNNISAGATLTLGQSIKIPTHLSQPIAAVPEQLSSPRVTAEVAALQPTRKVLADKENSLKIQEDEAIATLRAKQQNLAESIEQLRDQSTEVVFDADEAKTESSETLISSAALTAKDEPVAANPESVIIPVPRPATASVKVQDDPVTAPESLIANNTVASSSRLPEPPSLGSPTPELTESKQEQEQTSVVVPTVRPVASQPANTLEAKPDDAVSVPTTGATIVENQPSNAPVLVASAPTHTHTVRSGETLYAIARRYGVAGRDLIAANRLDNPNRIKVDQQLVIPNQQRAANSPSQFISLLPRTEVTQNVNRESQTLANSAAGSEEEVALAFEITAESAVNKLKADITRMRQDYQQQRAAESPKTPVVEFSLNNNNAASVVVNSEWQGKSPTVRTEIEAVDDTDVTAATQEVELAAASQESIANYNSLLRMSVGEVVAPELPPLANPDEYLPGSEVFNGYIWPAKGVLTSGYGRRWGRMHRGIDIAAPVGTPIFAAAGGEVVSAGWNSGGYGNLVKIKHSDESVTLYAHNSRILVRNGQQVKQGQQIAAMGSTGFSTGPHLHFEVHKPGLGAKNPIAYLPNR
ncbi:MAG: peptidoglycan DD-metalloendopeptidase family protein [Limnothrix sp. RL_2_0]|nr:peptidoglycan DD-metalloendopeptidase family protein [Limnothrix sp. RL_2_0]